MNCDADQTESKFMEKRIWQNSPWEASEFKILLYDVTNEFIDIKKETNEKQVCSWICLTYDKKSNLFYDFHSTFIS